MTRSMLKPFHLLVELLAACAAMFLVSHALAGVGLLRLSGAVPVHSRRQMDKHVRVPAGLGDRLAVPAGRIGGLALGDHESNISALFPKPSISHMPDPFPACGDEDYTVGLTEDMRHLGSLEIFVAEGKVREVEADLGPYRTANGIVPGMNPDEVRRRYGKKMESYLLLHGTPEALGGGPLVVWVDRVAGIAFSFAHAPGQHSQFSLYSIIVFQPGRSPCIGDYSSVNDRSDWRKLLPGSLRPTGGST